MGWPCRRELWGPSIDQACADYAAVANAIGVFEPVTMIANPGADAAAARAACGSGVEVTELPLDDSWLRDCGPIFRSSVGPPPSRRQRAAAQAVLGACSSFRRGDLSAGDRALSASGARIFLRSDGRSLPRRGGVTEVSRVEPRFSRVAAALSGVPATVVRCWSLPDWIELIAERGAYTGGAVDLRADGFVSEGTRVNLAPRMCERLVRFVYEGRRPGGGKVKLQLANSVLTLGHETVHVAPGGDEAVATCYGLQRMRRAGVLLGAPRAYADSLAELAWSGLYPFGLAKYHSPECKNGGKLDLNPRIPRWP